MGFILVLIGLFVMLYPAALLGGIIRGKIGVKAEPFRNLIHVGVYVVLVAIFVPMVA